MTAAEIAKHRDDAPLLGVNGCKAVRTLLDELETVQKQLADQEILARFWRQAAEQALDGWNRAEDERDALRDELALEREGG